MRAAEFLRSIADMLASIEDEKEKQPPIVVNVNNGGEPSSTVDDSVETPLEKDDVMVPPLQAKIELLKKMAGINSKNAETMELSDEDGPFSG